MRSERQSDNKSERRNSRFHILEDTRHFIYTDKMEFHVIELPKLPKVLRDDSGSLELWAKFINAEKQEEFAMIAEKDPYIQSAYDQLQEISQNKQKRLDYEARQKAILDHNQSMLEAEQRGREEGRELEAVSIALKMISLDIDDATIIAVTSLSPEKVKSLREDLERV
jgi:predicted transposase/invertase (TIGR01784 family)